MSDSGAIQRAVKLLQSGKTVEARDIFKSLVTNYPQDIDALAGFAVASLLAGRKLQASATFKRILKFSPDHPLARTFVEGGNVSCDDYIEFINISESIPQSEVPEIGSLYLLSKKSVDLLIGWLKGNGWAGYDPYDLKSFLLKAQVAGHMNKLQAEQLIAFEKVQPLEVRRRLGVPPRINAKAMGLFMGGFVRLYRAERNKDYLRLVLECADWLCDNMTPGMDGWGWGYPFDWDSVVMLPEGTPTSVNSYHVADGFWELYDLTNDEKWLEYCSNVAIFFTNDLNIHEISDDAVCFSYTPLDYYHVNNANLCVAEFLIRMGTHLDRSDWLELGMKGLNFALHQLKEQGWLTYWATGFSPTPQSAKNMDHYHTAAELRSLLRIKRFCPDHQGVSEAFQEYSSFYLDNFFEANGRPRYNPDKLYPINIHSGAEAAYILGEMFSYDPTPRLFELLPRFVHWFISTCQNADGSFLYMISEQQGQEYFNRAPFLRWGQAWSFRGLVAVLDALRDFPGGYNND